MCGSLELTLQWNRILELWAVGPATRADFESVVGAGLGRLVTLFIRLWLRRENVAVASWKRWILEDPLVHPYKWVRPDMVPPAPFLQSGGDLAPGGSRVD